MCVVFFVCFFGKTEVIGIVVRVARAWGEILGPFWGSLMFVPFSGARSKGIGFDGTRWYLTFSGGSGREEGWKEELRLCLRLFG